MSRTASPAPACARLTVCRALLMGCMGLIFASSALAGTKSAKDADEKKLPSKVTFIDAPSSETPAARKKRLKKECKGRPNAGACLGHTR